MIISHKHEFVFVHTRKAAGTSIAIALSAIAGPEDIIPRLPADDEALRRQVGGRGPQNQLKPLHASLQLRRRLQGRGPERINCHSSAAEAILDLGYERWNRYFTFTVERNPWDKAVSRYFWDRDYRGFSGSFTEYIRQCPPEWLSSWHLYTVDNQVAVDEILIYERLGEQLRELWRRIGVEAPPVPHAKGRHRPASTRDYRALFADERDVAYVAEICAREIDLLGYQFGSVPPALNDSQS